MVKIQTQRVRAYEKCCVKYAFAEQHVISWSSADNRGHGSFCYLDISSWMETAPEGRTPSPSGRLFLKSLPSSSRRSLVVVSYTSSGIDSVIFVIYLSPGRSKDGQAGY